MTIHDHARALASRQGITESAALAELGRRGATVRRARYGRTLLRATAPADLAAIESPKPRAAFWWQTEGADL